MMSNKLLYVLLATLTRLCLVSGHCEKPDLVGCHLCSDTNLECKGNETFQLKITQLQQYGRSNPGLKLVRFEGFNIVHLSKNVLGESTLNSLTSLTLRDNQIQTIDPGAFHHMPYLKTLVLDHNEWNFTNSSIHPRMFNHSNLETLSLNNAFATLTVDEKYTTEVLDMLKTIFVNSTMDSLLNLYMSRNGLYSLADNFFDVMPNLEVLDLSYNEFYKLKFNLRNLTKLRELRLNGNQLNPLEDESDKLAELTYLHTNCSLRNVTLRNNFIDCTCYAVTFYEWLTANKGLVSDADQVKCVAATYDSMVGKVLISLSKSKLVCGKPDKSSYLVLGIVMGIVSFIALIILFLNRKFFIARWMSCKETMGSKNGSEYLVYSSRYSSVHET